ncbi:MAG: 5'-3' exonuclease [Minisyncoccia bacterium]
MKKLFLIDANSLIHRTFHALPPLISKNNEPTNALYGLASILLALLRENPEFCAALFDRPEPTFRKKEFTEYKAQRPKAPDELISQIIEAHNLFEAFGIKYFEMPGFEADDLIASLANKFKNEPDLQIIILTGDRDTFQLVYDQKIIVRILKKGISETEDYDENLIFSKFKLLPKELVDFKALVGDPSDNIPGVNGIGPKTASDLIQRFKTVENLFQNLNQIPNLKEKLLKEKENVLLYKKLTILNQDLKINVQLEELKFNPSKEKLINYFEKFGFKSLINRVNNFNNKEQSAKSKQATIF